MTRQHSLNSEKTGSSPGLEPIAQKHRGSFRPCIGKLSGGLSVMKSPIDGLGCFATVRFPKNSPIAVYVGERINHTEAMRRMNGPGGKRVSELDEECYIDGSVNGNYTQYINHSCVPNADVFVVDGFLIVFALQEIGAAEEITVDYLNSFPQDRTVCQCGAASCRKKMVQKSM